MLILYKSRLVGGLKNHLQNMVRLRYIQRRALAVLWLVSVSLLVAWLAQRPARGEGRVRVMGRVLLFRAGGLRAALVVRLPGRRLAAYFAGAIAPTEGHSVVTLRRPRTVAATHGMCLKNGPRQLLGMEAVFAPHVNMTFAVVKQGGRVTHLSERVCVEFLRRRYGVDVASSVQAVAPPRRGAHRCATVGDWVGMDCRVGTTERAVVSDCVTRDALAPADAGDDCMLDNVCCREIKRFRRYFVLLNATGPLTPLTGAVRVTATRYDASLGVTAHEISDFFTMTAYARDTLAPATATQAQTPLFLVLDEAPGVFMMRDACVLAGVGRHVPGAVEPLAGSYVLQCLV